MIDINSYSCFSCVFFISDDLKPLNSRYRILQVRQTLASRQGSDYIIRKRELFATHWSLFLSST